MNKLVPLFACFACVPGIAFAQDATFTGTMTTTQSSSASSDELTATFTPEWQARFDRDTGFRESIFASRRAQQLFADYHDAYRRNRLEHAADCREAQRKANRDGLFSVTARCYRTSLLLEREFWLKNNQLIDSTPGVGDTVRAQAQEALASIIDAIDTVLFGIDGNVYTSIEDLQEAKRNLEKKYRGPVSLALSHLRAERTLSWIAHVLTSMLHITETEDLSPDAFEEMQHASYCLELGELFMREILNEQDYKKANLLLSQSLQHVQSCTAYVQKAYEKK